MNMMGDLTLLPAHAVRSIAPAHRTRGIARSTASVYVFCVRDGGDASLGPAGRRG